jgi:hypothetical protein
MTIDGKTYDPGNYPKIVLEEHSGPHMLIFQIANNSQGITFANKQPIWIQQGGKPQKWAKDPMIEWSIAGGGKKLFVIDWNSNDAAKGPVDLHYRLKFKGHGDLDPIIENGGGTVGGEEPPPPPPPPPPEPQGPGATASTESASTSTPGLFGNIDAVSIVIGLVVGFLLALVLFRK